MKFTYVLFVLLLGVASPALARDAVYHMKIQDVLDSADAKAALGDRVKFYFATQKAPAAMQQFGEDVANPKTNSFGKSDEAVCHRAMLDALLELRKRADKYGADAVVNIVSYYKKQVFASETEYECHAGGFVGGVALKGLFIKTGAKTAGAAQ